MQAVANNENPARVINININISSSLNDHATVSQSVKPVNIPQSVGSVQNVDISDKMEAKEDKSTCAIERMAAHPVRPSRSQHDNWTEAGSWAGWGVGGDSESGLAPQTLKLQEATLILAVQKLQERLSGVRKEKSPMVSAIFEDSFITIKFDFFSRDVQY